MADANEARRDGSTTGSSRHRANRTPPPSTRQVARDASELITALRAAADDWGDAVRLSMRRNPYGSLLIAAGVGYVLAGGLAPSAVRLAFGAGWRIAATALLRDFLDGSSANATPD